LPPSTLIPKASQNADMVWICEVFVPVITIKS
jgi:hypothetical protein